MATNKKAARSARVQAEPLIEEHDFELRVLKEFNKKLDLLIDQTVAPDSDAQHCFNMLKEQVNSSIIKHIDKDSLKNISSPIWMIYQV